MVTQFGCGTAKIEGLSAKLKQGNLISAQDGVDAAGIYYLTDLEAGDGYQIDIDDPIGKNLFSLVNVTVLADQPMTIISSSVDVGDIDVDIDGLPDCWEISYFGNLEQDAEDDFDNDEIPNINELRIGTNPAKEDTDSDGLRDIDELLIGTDPIDPDTDDDGLSDGYEHATGTDPNNDTIYYVGLGDSYSSGEGAGSYEIGTHEHDEESEKYNLCARSRVAYSTGAPGGDSNARILGDRTVDRTFIACSGAEILNVTQRGQENHKDGINYNGTIDRWPQISNIPEPVDFITITIGGNDTGFADVLEKCVWGASPCETDRIGDQTVLEFVNERLASLRQNLKETYALLREKGRMVFVLGYPRLLETNNECKFAGPFGSDFEFEAVDARFLNEAARVVNNIVECAALEAGVHFVDVDAEYTNRLCSDQETSSINEVVIRDSWQHVHESFHPNAAGHLQLARIVNTKINKLIQGSGFYAHNPDPRSTNLPLKCTFNDRINR